MIYCHSPEGATVLLHDNAVALAEFALSEHSPALLFRCSYLLLALREGTGKWAEYT